MRFLQSKLMIRWNWFLIAYSYRQYEQNWVDPKDYLNVRSVKNVWELRMFNTTGPFKLLTDSTNTLGIEKNLPLHPFEICFVF